MVMTNALGETFRLSIPASEYRTQNPAPAAGTTPNDLSELSFRARIDDNLSPPRDSKNDFFPPKCVLRHTPRPEAWAGIP